MTRTDIGTEVVQAVVDSNGVTPAELAPLYDYINPEVLLTLDEQDRREWSLTVRFSDHKVTVTHESRIPVDGVPYTFDASVR